MSITEIIIDGTRYEVKAIPEKPKQQDKPKEWEILELFSKSNKDVCTKDQLVIYNYLKNDSRYLIEWGIKVVKRGVDGEVFTIGDEVTFKPVEKFSWVIDNFFISNDGSMLVRSKDNMNVEILDDDLIKKHIPIPEKYLRKQPPVDKDTTQENFKWNDELVKEFTEGAIEMEHKMPHQISLDKGLYHFKKEKQSKSTPKEESKINVIEIRQGVSAENRTLPLGTYYCLTVNKSFPPEKYEAVKKAIEDVLNGKQPLLWEADKVLRNSGFKYTQDDLLKAQSLAFYESRLTHPMIGFKHKTFSDYIDSLKQNK